MAKIVTRKNVHLFLKAPGATAAAFAAADEVPQTLLQELNPTADGRSFEYDTFGSDVIDRAADIKDLKITATLIADPADTLVQLLLSQWNSADRQIDALVVAGDLPGLSASNVCVYGRMVIDSLNITFPRPGLAQIQLSLSAGVGSTVATQLNVTAYPSI